jgi:hypothetical protein
MTSYRTIQVVPDESLQPTQRELAGPPAGHVCINVEACDVCRSDAASVHPHPATEAGVVPGHANLMMRASILSNPTTCENPKCTCDPCTCDPCTCGTSSPGKRFGAE